MIFHSIEVYKSPDPPPRSNVIVLPHEQGFDKIRAIAGSKEHKQLVLTNVLMKTHNEFEIGMEVMPVLGESYKGTIINIFEDIDDVDPNTGQSIILWKGMKPHPIEVYWWSKGRDSFELCHPSDLIGC